MFTGIAECTGKLISIHATQDGYDVIIENTNSFEDLNINDSILYIVLVYNRNIIIILILAIAI